MNRIKFAIALMRFVWRSKATIRFIEGMSFDFQMGLQSDDPIKPYAQSFWIRMMNKTRGDDFICDDDNHT